MKKIFAAALALTMTAAMFTACGDTDSSSKADSTAETTTTAAESAAESEAEASSAEGSSAAEDASSEEAAEAKPFDVKEMPGYDESATETTLEIKEPGTDDWANGLGGNDFIDARTFTRDQDLTLSIDFELTQDSYDVFENEVFTVENKQILIGPCHANGWNKFADSEHPDGLITDIPAINTLPDDSEYTVDGENLRDKDGKMVDVFIKADGFIKFGDYKQNHIEFTIPAETVNAMIDLANEEESWEGILFQNAGGVVIKTIKLNQGNVYLNSAILEAFPEESEE
ncbi:MAG: hypothetical protein IJ740_01085 [Ruminococcus sp.]|nr:hypothetical protein [Ruminococcus sp.]